MSEACSKTNRQPPSDEDSRGAQLLVQAGFVNKTASGIYTLLPYGLRIVRKIESAVAEAMTAIGSQELAFPALQPRQLLESTNRWNVDVLYKLKSRGNKEFCLAFTHEENCAAYMGNIIQSYRDLPCSVFQIQSKFRDEPRARSGLLRCKEFRMKDMYSFHPTQDELNKYYDHAHCSYVALYERFGLADRTYLTFASGGDYSQYSHEYQTVCPVGEDTIYVCQDCGTAINREIFADLGGICPVCGGTKFVEERAVEVGNIFKLGTRFSEAYGYTFVDIDGAKKPIYMASYGIGITRIMGTVAEIRNDARGIVWPRAIAPFDIHLIQLTTTKEGTDHAESLFRALSVAGNEVLFDDRTGLRAGEKLNDCDLIGVPLRVVISDKSLQNNAVEVRLRDRETLEMIPLEQTPQAIETILAQSA